MRKAAKRTAKRAGTRRTAMKRRSGSTIAVGRLARFLVFSGRKVKTVGGLTKDGLRKNKVGKIVSKKMSARARLAFPSSRVRLWSSATRRAREGLGLEGFVPVGGKSAAGRALLLKVRALLA